MLAAEGRVLANYQCEGCKIFENGRENISKFTLMSGSR
jgi:hypothetical protein